VAGDRAGDLVRLEQRFGVQLPDDYRQLVLQAADDGYELDATDGSFLVLYLPDQLVGLNDSGDYQQRFRGGLAIGGDGGREILLYDFRQHLPRLVLLDITAESWEDALFQAYSLTELLDQFPQTGWLYETDDQ
jgi:hypothetical protein